MKPSDIISHYSFEPPDDITLKAIEHNFQLYFPGNYTVSWHESTNDVKLNFDDPHEEIMWLLRWS